MTALHLTGPVLARPRRGRAARPGWSASRLTLTRPTGSGDDHDAGRLGGPRPGRRALPHRARRAGRGRPRDRAAQALADRDAGALLLRDAGSPADTRWVDDRADLPGWSARAGTSPAPGATCATSPRRSSRTPLVAEVRRQAGPRRRVGQARRRLDRPRHRRPRALLAGRRAARGGRGGARGGRPGHRPRLRRGARCPTCSPAGIDGIEHATGLDRRPAAAVRRAAGVRRPDAGQHRDLPRHRRRRRGEVPGLRRAHAGPARPRATRRSGRRTRRACRSTPAPTPAARCAHGLVVDELLELVAAGLTPLEALSAGCWAARDWLGRDGPRRGRLAPTCSSLPATRARTCQSCALHRSSCAATRV